MPTLPDEYDLRHCPERAALGLLDSALHVAGAVLRIEYPTAMQDEPPARSAATPPPHLLARLLVKRCAELRELLHCYYANTDPETDDLPW
jgi:hypothetical protein